MDTTSLIRFTNIANNALLELAPATKSRLESSVGIWLQIEDGSRIFGEFLSGRKLDLAILLNYMIDNFIIIFFLMKKCN